MLISLAINFHASALVSTRLSLVSGPTMCITGIGRDPVLPGRATYYIVEGSANIRKMIIAMVKLGVRKANR